MPTKNTPQRERDLAALREKGFSKLTHDQQYRLLLSGDAPEDWQAGINRPLHALVGLEGRRFAGRTFEVVKINTRTYQLKPLDGGLLVNASKELVTDAPETRTAAGTAQDVPLMEHLAIGTLVRVRGLVQQPLGGIRNDDLAVVIADKGERVNIALLGGHGDQYARVGHRALTVVDPKEVLK